jgi:hypothetical protein
MSFSVFSSFLQKLAFQRFKNQLKNLSFVLVFNFSAFRLKKSTEKKKNKENSAGTHGQPDREPQ